MGGEGKAGPSKDAPPSKANRDDTGLSTEEKISHLQKLNNLLLARIDSLRKENDDLLKKQKERQQGQTQSTQVEKRFINEIIKILDKSETEVVSNEGALMQVASKELEAAYSMLQLNDYFQVNSEEFREDCRSWEDERYRLLKLIYLLSKELKHAREEEHIIYDEFLKETVENAKESDEMNDETIVKIKEELQAVIQETNDVEINILPQKEEVGVMSKESEASQKSWGDEMNELLSQISIARKEIQNMGLSNQLFQKAREADENNLLHILTESEDKMNNISNLHESELCHLRDSNTKLKYQVHDWMEAFMKERYEAALKLNKVSLNENEQETKEMESLNTDKAFLGSEKVFLEWSLEATKGLKTKEFDALQVEYITKCSELEEELLYRKIQGNEDREMIESLSIEKASLSKRNAFLLESLQDISAKTTEILQDH